MATRSRIVAIESGMWRWVRIDNILEDRHRKRVRFLEQHSHLLAQSDGIDAGRINVAALEFDPAGNPQIIDKVVHTVETAEQSGFAATGWPDERGHELTVYSLSPTGC